MSSSVSWAQGVDFYFKVSPWLELLYPHSDPATLSLLITAADGKPVTRGWAEIRLDAPAPGWLFSTDFPLVEGSRLIEMRLPLRQGKAEWKYVFPIRGTYRLSVEYVSPEEKKTGKTFSFRVRENTSKWFFLGFFTLGLFVCGVIAGRIFTPAKSTRTATASLCLLLSCVVVAYCNDDASGQESVKGGYFGWLEVSPATVGKPASISWRLQGDENAVRSAALLTLTITHLEKEKTVFAVERIPVARAFKLEFQFTDGADYRVTATASVAGWGNLRTEQNISVSGVEPPATAMLPAMAFFLLIVAGGLAAGRWSRRRAAG